MPGAWKPRPPRFLYSPGDGRGGRGAGRSPATRSGDRDLLLLDRDLTPHGPGPRDRGPALLRRRGRDQRVHGRIPGTEPRARARRRPRAQLRVRARVQRAAREGREGARLARRVEPLLPLRARVDGSHRALRAPRTLDHAPVRLRGRTGGPRRRALARALPGGCPARPVGNRRRHSQQLRTLHDPGDHADLLEPRDHRGARGRRAAGGDRVGQALRLRGRNPRGDGDPGAAPHSLAHASGRAAAPCHRLARPGRASASSC